MIDRRRFLASSSALAGSALAGTAAVLPITVPAPAQAEAVMNDDGLYTQTWFVESFLDLREDLGEAASAGKRFAILWEQRGCPYCKEMHTVNLAKPAINDYVKEKFAILQLNLWGSRSVTDFDGEELEERNLANKWRVNFTPTISFFPEDAADGKNGREIEVYRMPGYFKPFHFLSMFEYVEQKAYADQNFQRFLQDKFKRLEAEGKSADVW